MVRVTRINHSNYCNSCCILGLLLPQQSTIDNRRSTILYKEKADVEKLFFGSCFQDATFIITEKAPTFRCDENLRLPHKKEASFSLFVESTCPQPGQRVVRCGAYAIFFYRNCGNQPQNLPNKITRSSNRIFGASLQLRRWHL